MNNKLKKSDTAASKTVSNKQTVTVVENTNTNNQDEVSKYIMSLTEQEQQTLDIAKSHLGTSFNIKRSIGFLEWKAKQ
jgi:hypothetical protein